MTQAQKTYEKLLGVGTWILILWHMLMTLGKYFCSTYKAEMAFAGLLAAAAVIYLILSLFKWKETRYRIRDFFKKFRSPNQILCMILFVWTVISFIANGCPELKDNVWLIFDTGINCLILFNLPAVLSKEKTKAAIDLLLHILSLFGLGVVLFGLWHLFTLDFITLKTGEIIGMTGEHTFRLGCHYNLTAAIALSFILIAFYMMATQPKWIKVLYTIYLIPHTLALLLTNSRAGFIACVSAYFFAAFLALWNHPGKHSVPVRLLISLIGSSAAAGIIWMMRTWAFQLFETVTHFSSVKSAFLPGISVSDTNNKFEISQCMALFTMPSLLAAEKLKKWLAGFKRSISKTATISLITAGFLFLSTISDFVCPMPVGNLYAAAAQTDESNGKTAVQAGEDAVRDLNNMGTMKSREQIWKTSIEVMESNTRTFLFGVTPLEVAKVLANHRVSHAHNQILQVGICIGAPMMIVFVILLVLTGIKCIPLGLLNRKQHFHGAYILPAIFISYIILTLVEAYLFASFSIMSSLFFLFTGWINAMVQTKEE